MDDGKLLKEIYRKLTSAIHPDREPNVAERTRALMREDERFEDALAQAMMGIPRRRR